MKTVIAQVIEETEKRIDQELRGCNQVIADFTKPFKIPLDPDEKQKYLEERMSGRLSCDSLTKAYERKGELERQQTDIANFKFFHKELLGEKC